LTRWLANRDDSEIAEVLGRVYSPLLTQKPNTAKEMLLGRGLTKRLDPEFLGTYADDHIRFREAVALHLFQITEQDSALIKRMRRCKRRDCRRYFLNTSGQQSYCCRQHAQAAVNEKWNARRKPKKARQKAR